jgi:hypothetical protein
LIKDTNNHAVRAQDIQVGDILSGNKVTHILTVQRRGLYAPLTESGTILVSGVTASCYVDIAPSVMPTIQACASHAALAPLRILCAWKFSICQNETYTADGYSSNLLAMAQFGLQIATWNGALQWMVAIVSFPAWIGFFALETIVLRYWLYATAVSAASIVAGWVLSYVCKMMMTNSMKKTM